MLSSINNSNNTMSIITKPSFETLAQEFCSMYNKMEGCPFGITPKMIFNNCHDVPIAHRIGSFVKHLKKKWGYCPSWANERTYVGRGMWDLPLLKNAVLEQMRVSYKVTGANPTERICLNGANKRELSNMFEMCKAMADLTPHSHAQALLISLKRTAPKLYAVNDVVSQLNSYVKLGEFTEDDFRDIMMSDKGMLVIRLYLSYCAINNDNFRSNKCKRRGNVFSHQRAKRRKAFFTKRAKERLREYNRKKKFGLVVLTF
jgi:hypothetical protein